MASLSGVFVMRKWVQTTARTIHGEVRNPSPSDSDYAEVLEISKTIEAFVKSAPSSPSPHPLPGQYLFSSHQNHAPYCQQPS